ncbi:probable E3 ubiquitin-protein ligase XERICO [Pyrus communis]|uniref:probable E3 ubiquitin-protein ligase XERICO n=1 Tax=Pyrus communis TaxID=23211 RepID=UPI0035C1CCA8
MGLSNFPSAAGGVLPLLVMNTVFYVALLKNMARSVLQVMGANINSHTFDENPDGCPEEMPRERRISITQFKSFCRNGGKTECCVCLCGFEAEQEVSELSCKHFFHKSCLEKWFDHNSSTTCPLCRSID